MKNKIKTINLQGKEYAQVSERVKYFNANHPNGSIITDPEIQGEGISVKATIIPNFEKPERKFTGHSFGKIGKEKALEKLETVAVGRALAFMGILADGGIASQEEIDKFEEAEAFKGNEQNGWDLKNYKQNPVLLASHNHREYLREPMED